tara:strand:- start:6481 stop:6645 length:165 start_codon:yes stop_codon:yes gene_type:complete
MTKREPLDFDTKNQNSVTESLSAESQVVQPTIRITNLSLQDEDGVILEFKSHSN